MSARSPSGTPRDLRVDFFRGIALWFIFVDHVPNLIVGSFTPRNFGLSDATEIFVFLSGYSAALAYGPQIDRHGFLFASAQVWRRTWQLYVAHLVLFMFYAAHVAWVGARLNNPMYVEESNLAHLLDEPHVVLLETLALRFRPLNMDVLPLYIVLLLLFPLVLWGLRRSRLALLGTSLAIYAATHLFELNLAAYPPPGRWYFNPFAWQLLFVLGAIAATLPSARLPARWLRAADALALVWIAFSLWLVLSWSIPAIEATVPQWLAQRIYPIDKTNLDLLRLLHFFALAHLVVRLIPRDAAFLHARWTRPALACGQQSLYVFCLGIYLSMAAHLILTEVHDAIAMQLATAGAGIALMSGLAVVLNWYKRQGDRRAGRAGTPTATAGARGAEAASE